MLTSHQSRLIRDGESQMTEKDIKKGKALVFRVSSVVTNWGVGEQPGGQRACFISGFMLTVLH